jgi:hypothetical protein
MGSAGQELIELPGFFLVIGLVESSAPKREQCVRREDGEPIFRVKMKVVGEFLPGQPSYLKDCRLSVPGRLIPGIRDRLERDSEGFQE